ncbi:MAG: AIM24 family protein [Clostridiales bacterium]|nr:AIM24 family protein [Clostridiales bacterium]
MLTFEVCNELTLKVTCSGSDVLFTKTGAFIAGDSAGGKNYRFEKVLLGPQQNLLSAALGSLARRVTGENLPLTKVIMQGDSETYYANFGQHVLAYHLEPGEVVNVESENLLAFTQDCDYSVRFLGQGVLSQKGLATTTLTGRGKNAYVALLSSGNPLVLSNVQSRSTLTADPDALICWMGDERMNNDPQIKTDLNWKNLIGQHSGESYMFEWGGNQTVTVLIQPSERSGGIRVSVD